MPSGRTSHTQNGPTACGGNYLTNRTCSTLTKGGWSAKSAYLVKPRNTLVSWTRPDGGIQLFGGVGDESDKTSETVREGQLISVPSYDLPNIIVYVFFHCLCCRVQI